VSFLLFEREYPKMGREERPIATPTMPRRRARRLPRLLEIFVKKKVEKKKKKERQKKKKEKNSLILHIHQQSKNAVLSHKQRWLSCRRRRKIKYQKENI
jgi:hypothetical protein